MSEMTDIVERLRGSPLDLNPHLKQEAADEIERLRGIVNVMREDCIYAEDQWAKTKGDLRLAHGIIEDYRAEEASMNQHTDRQAMRLLADDLDESVGLYRKMPDGRMVEIHIKKIALIQTALRAAAALSRT